MSFVCLLKKSSISGFMALPFRQVFYCLNHFQYES